MGRLSPQAKNHMRSLYEAEHSPWTHTALAAHFNVSTTTVKRILNPAEAERSYRLTCGDETARLRAMRGTGRREDHTRDLHAQAPVEVSDKLPYDGPRIADVDPLLQRLIAAHGQPREDIAKDLLKHTMRYA